MSDFASVDPIDETRLIDLTKGLCRIPSPLGEEGPLASYAARELERLGFEVELQEIVSGRCNVVGVSRGSPDFKSFMLNGHLDMPMPSGRWKRDPFDPWIEADILYGGGIQDMKGGLAALMAGAAAASAIERDTRGDIVVTAVMHHDTTGLGTKYFLETTSWVIDAGINGEPTNLDIQLFHGGAWCFEIRMRGIPRHQVRLEEGVSAIEGMLSVVQRLTSDALTYTADSRHPELPRVVVGTISGGEKHTMTAEACVARGDIRWLPSMTIDGMKTDIQRLIEEVCAEMPGLEGSVSTWRGQWPYEIPVGDPVVESVMRAHTRIAGSAPRLNSGLPMSAAITDTADMVRHGIPSALYGPGDWRTEANEGILIDDLITAANVYAAVSSDFVTQRRS